MNVNEADSPQAVIAVNRLVAGYGERRVLDGIDLHVDEGEIRAIMTGSVDEVRNSNDPRIQDMLNRRPREKPIDAAQYLQRLTEQRRH